MRTQRFSLGIGPGGGSPFEAHVSQHDIPVRFEVELHAEEGELSVPASASATVEGTTASGQKVAAPCTRSGLTVRFDLPDEMTMEMGRHEMAVVLTDGGRELRSRVFAVCVEGDPVLL